MTRENPSTPQAVDQAAIEERRRQFGERLKQLRVDHGFSAAAVAQATRIAPHFIAALETGAFATLPGQVFGRGFVRGLCKQLQVDATELLVDYDACWSKVPEASVLKVQIKNKPMPDPSESLAKALRILRSPTTWGVTARLALPVVGLAGVLYLVAVSPVGGLWKPWLSRTLASSRAAVASLEQARPTPAAARALDAAVVVAAPPAAATAPDEPLDPVAATSAAVMVETAPPAAALPAVEAAPAPSAAKVAALGPTDQVLELVVTAPVRVRVGLDDAAVVTQELQPQTYHFNFKAKAELMVYDAAALKISYNGRPLGALGSKGRIRRLSFQAAPPTDKKL